MLPNHATKPLQRWRLQDVGRDKFTGEVAVKNEGELLNAVKSHLMSDGVALEDGGHGDRSSLIVTVGGLREVGKCYRIISDTPCSVVSLCDKRREKHGEAADPK